VSVFAPLDALFAERNVSPMIIAAIMATGLVFVICGIFIEESR